MAGVWEIVQEIASLTRHVSELRTESTAIKSEIRSLREEVTQRIRAVELDVATLKAGEATTRETVRAEIATAIADLRVQWAELEARRHRPRLEEG